MKKIELSGAEIQMAAFVGCQRVLEKIKAKESYSVSGEKPETLWERYVPGSIAEAALAKYLNVYWHKGKKSEADAGNCDCRCTPYDNGHLEIHKNDPDDRRFYLLTGYNGTYVIRGWIYAKEGKQEKYWRVMQQGRQPQYWIPQADLHPLETEAKIFNPETWLDE